MENKCENPELQVIVSAIEVTNKVINVCNDAQPILEKIYEDEVVSQMAPSRSSMEDTLKRLKERYNYYVELLKKFIAYKDNQKVELSDAESRQFVSIGDCSNEDMELCKRLVEKYNI